MTALDFDKLIEGEDTFGLDISNTRVKAMWVTKSGRSNLHLQSFGEETIPASAVVGGIIRRPEVVAEAIKKILKNSYPKPIRTKYAICSISQEKVYLKIEDFPNIEKEKLREAVTWKANKVLAMPLEKIYWDWHRLNPKEDESTVSIQFAAVEKEVVDSYVHAIRLAGIIPLAFEMESSAAGRVLLASNEELKESPLLFVDIGNSNTNLSIYHQGGFRFNSSVNVGGNQVTKIIGTEKGLSPVEAEEYQRTTGLKTKTETLQSALSASLTPIISEMMGAMRFYDKTPGKEDDIKLAKVYGDGASLKGVDKYLDEQIPDLKVGYANPSIGMIPIPQFISHEKIFPHLVVTGLALKGLGKYHEFGDVNFLPADVQKAYVNEQLKKKVGNIVKILSINIIAICGFLLGGLFLLTEESSQIQATINSKKAILQGSSIQTKSLEISKFNESLASISSIINSEFDWIKIFDKILSVTPGNVVLDNIDIYVDESLAPKSEPIWIISLYGRTDNRQTVIDYSTNLISTEVFSNVQIPVSAFSSGEEVEFRINMDLSFTNLLANPENFAKKSTTQTTGELELKPFTPAK